MALCRSTTSGTRGSMGSSPPKLVYTPCVVCCYSLRSLDADIKVTPEEMSMIGHEGEGMRLTDGSGYYAQMAVHHNLHCLGSIRELYRDVEANISVSVDFTSS